MFNVVILKIKTCTEFVLNLLFHLKTVSHMYIKTEGTYKKEVVTQKQRSHSAIFLPTGLLTGFSHPSETEISITVAD